MLYPDALYIQQKKYTFFIATKPKACERKRAELRFSSVESNFLFNRELDTQERNKLIEEIGYPKKWTSFKKWIESSQKYSLKKKRIRGKDFFIINQN